MRDHPAYLPQLALVAECDGQVVGSIHYAQSFIQGDDGNIYETVALGPIAVLPVHQHQGIGKELIEHSAKLAADLGYRAIGLYGDPDYYSKHGFRQAAEFDIRTPDDDYLAPMQLRELHQGALNGVSGRYFERATGTIEMPEDKVTLFDSQFPAKTKISGTETQMRFSQLVAMRTPRTSR